MAGAVRTTHTIDAQPESEPASVKAPIVTSCAALAIASENAGGCCFVSHTYQRPQLCVDDVATKRISMKSHFCEYLALAYGCYRSRLPLPMQLVDRESRTKKIWLETKKNNDGETQHARPA
jgi:hypothetical protein